MFFVHNSRTIENIAGKKKWHVTISQTIDKREWNVNLANRLFSVAIT